MNWSVVLMRFLESLLVTAKHTVVSLLLGAVLGMLFCFMALSRNKVLNIIDNIYLDIIRGTPLIVQVFLIYFGIPQLLQTIIPAFRLSSDAAGIITLTRHDESHYSAGSTHRYSDTAQSAIITLKNTSVLSVISIRELTQTGKLIITTTFESFKTWALVAVMHLFLIKLLSMLSNRIERSLRNGTNGKSHKS